MIRSLLSIFIVFGFTYSSIGQFSAGPDKTICSGTGAHLGIPTQTIPETWCVTWSPAESLDDPHSVLPHASPKITTVYTVTVLTDDWQSVITDEVKVTVGFGGIKFTPPHLYQGSDLTVMAQATINPDNDEVTWSIQGESLGCMIDPSTGVITPGAEYGTITIRATKTEDMDCFAEETIDINEGVKDVTAHDATHPTRIAKDGVDTLYLIGESQYVVTAIPNASGFSPGTPLWYNDGTDDAIVPGDGLVTIAGGLDTEHHYTAGSEDAGHLPKVIIVKYNSDEFTIDISPLVNELTNKVEEINKKLKEKIGKKFPSVPNLSVEANVAQIKYKRSRAEKFNDPGFDYKYTFEAGGNIAVSGKLYHPAFTQLFDLSIIGITAGTELYLEPYIEASLVGAVTKDPSKEDPTWTFINPVKANATGGVKGVFNVVGTGAGYSLEGGFSLNAEFGADLTFNPLNGELKIKFTLAPLQGVTKVLIERYVDPKKKWTFFNYTVDLIDKWNSPEYLLYNFGQ
jgi:hypothetical protein